MPHSFLLHQKFTINKGSTCSEQQFVPSEDLEEYGIYFQSLCNETLLHLISIVFHFICYYRMQLKGKKNCINFYFLPNKLNRNQTLHSSSGTGFAQNKEVYQ